MILPVPTNQYSTKISVLYVSDSMQSVWQSPSHWICTTAVTQYSDPREITHHKSDFGVFQATIVTFELGDAFSRLCKVVLWLLEAS